jgi:hypothetical protein
MRRGQLLTILSVYYSPELLLLLQFPERVLENALLSTNTKFVSVLVLAVTGFRRSSGAASSLFLAMVLSLLYVASSR